MMRRISHKKIQRKFPSQSRSFLADNENNELYTLPAMRGDSAWQSATKGSAASKMEKRQISWVQLFTVVIAVLVIFATAQQAVNERTAALAEQKRDLTVQQTHLKTEKDQLEEDLDAVGTKGYIRERAREDYQFIQPGELRFEIENPEALGLNGDESEASLP